MTRSLIIAFDADDTLWHNEQAFADAEHRFNDIVAPWADAETAQAVLVSHERARLPSHGYGVKSFVLAMVAAACDLSNNEIGADVVASIVEISEELLTMPTVMIDGALDVLRSTNEQFPTMIITKGDLHHQLRRIEEASIAKYCFDVEVVADKDVATYTKILTRHRIEPEHFVMVGNSVVSDVAPVIEAGGRAVHIPYEVTWALETGADPAPSDRWFRLEQIAELPELLETLRND